MSALRQLLREDTWVKPFFGRYRKTLAASLVLGVAALAFAVGLMFTSGYLISDSAEQPNLGVYALFGALGFVQIFGIVKPFLTYYERLASHDWVLRMTSHLRVGLYNSAERQGVFYLATNRLGDTLGLLSADVGHVQNLYLRTVFPLITAWALLALAVLGLGAFDWFFALGMLLCLGTLCFLFPLVSVLVNGARQLKAKTLSNETYTAAYDAVAGVSDWVFSQRRADFMHAIMSLDARTAQTERAMTRFAHARDLLAQLVFCVGSLAVLAWAAARFGAVPQELAAAGFDARPADWIAAFVLGFFPLMEAFAPLSDAAVQASAHRDSIERLNQLGDARELMGAGAAMPLPHASEGMQPQEGGAAPAPDAGAVGAGVASACGAAGTGAGMNAAGACVAPSTGAAADANAGALGIGTGAEGGTGEAGAGTAGAYGAPSAGAAADVGAAGTGAAGAGSPAAIAGAGTRGGAGTGAGSGAGRLVMDAHSAIAGAGTCGGAAGAEAPGTCADAAGVCGFTLSLTNVSFRYAEDEKLLLNGMSLNIPFGQRVAILGPSGAGKSTLLALLRGDLTPSQGAVTLGGVPVSAFGEGIARYVGVIQQDTYLFNQSLLSNLRMGDASITPEQAEQALRNVGLGELLARLPQGLRTVADEAGLRFSGGERHRIAIARILLHNTPIVLLDEPMAALDQATETALLKTMLQAFEGRTVVMVTHHLLGIEHMDRVVFLREGQVFLDGTPAALAYENAYYQQLLAFDRGEWIDNSATA